MKNRILIFVLISAFSSCSKDGEPQISENIIGRWVWVESSGGIGGITETPTTTENEVIIEFSDNKCTKYLNGNIDYVLTYTIEKGNSILTQEETELIIYENGLKQSFKLDGQKLILFNECYDCFQNEYIKE